LSEILETTKELGPCLVFCDEIDSLGFSRDAETHEVTRRTLSVLLRHLDGLEGPPESILVAATNMPGLLDPALISRFDVVISFELPDLTTRAAILGRYAKQLNDDEKRSLAKFAEGFSGRELRDACEAAERAHAGRVVRVTAAAIAGSSADCTDERQVDRFCEEYDHDVAHVQQLPSYDDYVAAISRKGLTSISHLHREKQTPAANHQSAMAA
jgi:ATP-dependent 26S proteasome regulatory subunit